MLSLKAILLPEEALLEIRLPLAPPQMCQGHAVRPGVAQLLAVEGAGSVELLLGQAEASWVRGPKSRRGITDMRFLFGTHAAS